MADRRRLVSKSDITGTVTTIRDWEDGSTMLSVKDSWIVTPGQRKTTHADSQRRYGGSIPTGETHTNGFIEWSMLIKGATADACIASVEAMLGDLESLRVTRDDLYVEWRPDGATSSVYYEIRGPGEWKTDYKWAQFAGALSLVVSIRIPVAPLADGAAIDIAITSTTMPATVALATAIPGNAPARASLALTTSGGGAPPIFALIGWTKRPTTPLASSSAPFGVFNASSAMTPTTWAVVAHADYRGGNGLQVTTAGAGTASALLAVDPSTLVSDDFTPGEVTVELWATVKLAATVVSPRLILSVQPFAGTSFGGEQFSAEFGSVGKLLTVPTATAMRHVKLGTLTLPVDAAQPLKHNIKVAASWAAGSSGTFGLSYVAIVLARQRALSPTSKTNDASYPKFIASTGATTKTIRHDLSGRVASGAGNPGRDSGLGGSLLELPPGDVDLLVKLSTLVPDDPTLDATSEQLSHTVTGALRVTPRYWLAR
jgi:hypothetical protein